MRQVAIVIDCRVRAEGNVEFAALVETAQSVEAGAVQVVEQLRRFLARRFAVAYQLIEPVAMTIEELLVVAHLDTQLQSRLQMAIEVDEVRIDVVQQRAARLPTERDSQPAAEWFDVPMALVLRPDWGEM